MTTATEPAAGGAGTGEKRHLRRDIGKIGLLFTGVGSIIGSGWLFAPMNTAAIAGPAAIFSWIIAAVMIMLIGLTFAEIGVMFPVTGGVIRFPQYTHGSFASYTMGWITWLAAAVVPPIEVTGTLQYATATKVAAFTVDKIPGPGEKPVHTLTPLGIATAILLLAVFCIINVLGVRFFAQINNVLVWWKLAVIAVAIIALLFASFHAANFNDAKAGGFAPGGASGIFTCIATAGITFSFLGFRQGIELAGETKNPKRNVPFAVVGSIAICAAIYILLQIAFMAALDPTKLAEHGWAGLDKVLTSSAGPLASISMTLGMAWLAYTLYVDAVVSPGDTGLIYSAVTSRLGYVMARNGNAPAGIAKLTRTGVPWVSTIITFALGIVFLLPFPSWQQLVGLVTSATVLSFGSGPLVWAALRKEMPDRERPFRLPGGHVIPFLAFLSSNMIVFWAGWSTNWKFFIAILIGLVLLGVFKLTGQLKYSALNLKSGMWAIVWLAGLAVISFVGIYLGGEKPNPPNSWLLWGLGASLVLSVFVYWMAMATRLPRVKIEEIISNTPHDEVEAAH